MNVRRVLRRPGVVVLVIVIIISFVLAILSYRQTIRPQVAGSGGFTQVTPRSPTPTPQATIPSKATTIATPALTLPPVQDSSHILGIDINGDTSINLQGISWVRMGYPSCGSGNQRGDVLRNTIQTYHSKGIRVLLTICQPPPQNLDDTSLLKDAAQGYPDAVQCGNEEMKQDSSVSFLYVAPGNFARFYDLCQSAVHAVRPEIPVLLGSLDPHVGGVDYQPLVDQASYLDQMQSAMNSSVHPGGNWNWRSQTLGLIDSWHNGYPDASVNSLYGLFLFWAQQFQVDLNSGALGKHLWVVEGTGCFKGCGVDASSAYQVAVSHILALTTDVQTTMSYKIPFFFFSGKDFEDQGVYWPIGVLDVNGHPKPIRQDLSMGARKLTLSCPGGTFTVIDQAMLLAQLYSQCTVPANYYNIIES